MLEDILKMKKEGMNIRLPKEVLKWVDENKGEMTRPAFIVHVLVKLSK